MFDVYGSLSKPIPSSFKIAHAVMLFPRRDDRPIEQIYHLSQQGIRLLQGLYTDNDALKSNRASMVQLRTKKTPPP